MRKEFSRDVDVLGGGAPHVGQRRLPADDLRDHRGDQAVVLAQLLVDLVRRGQETGVRRQLGEGITLVALRGQAGRGAHARMADLDDGLVAPSLGIGEHGEDPLHRVHALDRLAAGERNGPGDAPGRLARERVERLDPAPVLDGDRAEGIELRPRSKRARQGQHAREQHQRMELHGGSPVLCAPEGPGRRRAGPASASRRTSKARPGR